MLSKLPKEEQQEDLLFAMIQDPHPQVRLEVVNAIRENQLDIAIAMKALELPMDENLDYALWLTVRTLESQWLPLAEAKNQPFGEQINVLAYALLAVADERAMALLVPILQSDQLNEEDRKKTLQLLAKLGGEKELAIVLQAAKEEDDLELLQALVQAPSDNEAVPENGNLLAGFFQHKEAAFRSSAIRLVGRWKAEVHRDWLKQQFVDTSVLAKERIELGDALMALGDSTLVMDWAKKARDVTIQATATVSWAKANRKAAVAHVVELLGKMEDPELAEALFRAYTRNEEGPDMLTAALEDKHLSKSVAIIGNQSVQSSGRALPELVQAINKAGNLKSIGVELSAEARAELIEKALAEGEFYRGRQIYNREALLCTSCHMVEGKGGKVGPDLTSVGAYMTPESLLESMLNPATDIKQGYETVILSYKNGTTLSGTLHRKTGSATLIRDSKGTIITVPNSEIENLETSPVSFDACRAYGTIARR